LHKSEFYHEKHDGRELKFSDNYSDCLIRLPLFFELESQIDSVVEALLAI
jgi:dTDP-4-amino-4,6-dideoxygalactose transaminase